ncbi:hypothetical protein C2S51_014334 [Perilla frutescens var. frutescens]|nr:hypothetical protein C2S51_014334 [Perilla frutescens var. frutescens]
MLNYWRTTGGTGGGSTTFFTGNSTSYSRSTANDNLIPAAGPFSDYGLDGPFFDLEFTPLNDNEASETTETESNSDENLPETDDEMREIELNLDIDDQDFKISPFCKGPSSNDSEENSKFSQSLLKLKFKPNSSNGVPEKGEKSEKTDVSVKFKVDGVKGPLISLFARDITMSEATNSGNLGKETLQKYLNILKHLYVRVENMKLSGGGGGGAVSPPAAVSKAGVRGNNLPAGFKVVRKHLGKSRSTSAAAAVSPQGKMGSNRRDDSLLEVQDGIQGAILHCKRSFNSNREVESAILSRSVSDP